MATGPAVVTPSELAKTCAPFLGALGFKKRAGEVFTIELADNVVGWLGLNRATQHRAAGEIEVNPVVGVRHQGVERLVAECRGEQAHAYLPPTVSTPLGYLLPEGRYRAWIFSEAAPADAVAQAMTEAIDRYGLPFMHSAAALPELIRRLQEGTGHRHQLAYRRPVALLLAGERQQARADLDAELAELGERDDPAADDFRRFAAALRERINSGDPDDASC